MSFGLVSAWAVTQQVESPENRIYPMSSRVNTEKQRSVIDYTDIVPDAASIVKKKKSGTGTI